MCNIGSLGEHGSYSMVEDVQVRKCTFNGTTNGARIKTWKVRENKNKYCEFYLHSTLPKYLISAIYFYLFMVCVKTRADQGMLGT